MPKNIVLLSDGTGNSSANIVKTNVWRLYEALDLTDPIAPGRLLRRRRGDVIVQAAHGVGAASSVSASSAMCCISIASSASTTSPGIGSTPSDSAEGRSPSGYFAGLIADQGLVRTPRAARPGPPTGPGESTSGREAALLADDTRDQGEPAGAFGPELARLARWAYRRFRRHFNQTGNLSLVPTARWLRDRLVRLTELAAGHAPYEPAHNLAIDEIAFLGLWDTVDAYGLPIDELTDGIDKWVWPLSMPSLELSPKVRKACHVLALDDERNTFHPTLWDEST